MSKLIFNTLYEERKAELENVYAAHGDYLNIDSLEKMHTLAEYKYLYFLISDFLFALVRKDFTIWDNALNEGKLIFKVEQLRSVFSSLTEVDDVFGEIGLTALEALEVARTKAKSFDSNDVFFGNFKVLSIIFSVIRKKFEDCHNHTLNEYIFLHWPKESTLNQLSVIDSIKREKPSSQKTELVKEDVESLNLHIIGENALYRMWLKGFELNELKDFYFNYTDLSELKQISFLEESFDLKFDTELFSSLKEHFEKKEKAANRLPKNMFPHLIVTSVKDSLDLLSNLNIAGYRVSNLTEVIENHEDRKSEEFLIRQLRSSVRTGSDIIFLPIAPLKNEEEYQFLTSILTNGIAVVLAGDKSEIDLVTKKMEKRIGSCPIFLWTNLSS